MLACVCLSALFSGLQMTLELIVLKVYASNSCRSNQWEGVKTKRNTVIRCLSRICKRCGKSICDGCELAIKPVKIIVIAQPCYSSVRCLMLFARTHMLTYSYICMYKKVQKCASLLCLHVLVYICFEFVIKWLGANANCFSISLAIVIYIYTRVQ